MIIKSVANEYIKFIEKWKVKPIDGYYLDEMGPETGSHINHTKIRKDGTTLASSKEYKKNNYK